VNSTKDLGAARRLLLASVFVLVNVNLRLGLLDLSLRQFVSWKWTTKKRTQEGLQEEKKRKRKRKKKKKEARKIQENVPHQWPRTPRSHWRRSWPRSPWKASCCPQRMLGRPVNDSKGAKRKKKKKKRKKKHSASGLENGKSREKQKKK